MLSLTESPHGSYLLTEESSESGSLPDLSWNLTRRREGKKNIYTILYDGTAQLTDFTDEPMEAFGFCLLLRAFAVEPVLLRDLWYDWCHMTPHRSA